MATVVQGIAAINLTSPATSYGLGYPSGPTSGNLLVAVYMARDNGSAGVPVATPPTGFTQVGFATPMEYHTVWIAWRTSDGTEGTATNTVTWDRSCNSTWLGLLEINQAGVSSWTVDKSAFDGSGSSNVSSIASGSTGTLSSSVGAAVMIGTSRTGSENLTCTIGTSLTGSDVNFEDDAGSANVLTLWQNLTATTALNPSFTESSGSSRMGAGIAVFVEASGGSTFTGTAAQSLAGFGQSASGTSTPPSFTGTAAQSLAGFGQSASGTSTPPSFTGTAAQSLAGFGQSASGTSTPPSFTGTAAQSLAGFGQSASGTSTPPSFTGTAAQSLAGFGQSASGTSTPPSFTGTAAQSLAGFGQSASGTSTPPSFTGSAVQTLAGFGQSASGTTQQPGYSAGYTGGYSGSSLTTDFDLGVLPAGWTFEQNSAANAAIAHTNDFATVTIPPGTTSNSISSVGSSDDTAGLVHSVTAGGDLDVAVRVGTTRNDDDSTMYGFILREAGDTGRMVRWTPYSTGANFFVYGYERYDGVGNNFQSPTNMGTAASLPGGTSLSGSPAWMRASRVGSLYTFYLSYDGSTWYEAASVTSSVDANEVKLLVGQYDQNLGQPFSYDSVVDLLSAGTTDARGAEPARYQGGTQAVTDFTGGLPAWLTVDSVGDGSAGVSGSVVQLSTGSADGSYGRLEYNGAGDSGAAGVLVKARASATASGAFSVVGLASQDGAGTDIDQYSPTPAFAYEAEMSGASANNPPLRAHRPYAVGGAHGTLNEAYSFLTPRKDWNPTGGALHWFRVERYDGWVFLRAWEDGGAEPSTWDFAGPERTLSQAGPVVPYVGIAHNDGTPVAATLDVHEVHFYALVATEPPDVTGTAASSLPPVTTSATGTVEAPPGVFGPIAQTLPAFGQSASGTYDPPDRTGAAAQTLPAFEQSAVGSAQQPGYSVGYTSGYGVAPDRTGAADQTLPAFEQSASGTNDRPGVDGPIAQNLPAFEQSATGAHTTPPAATGTAAQTLPAFEQSASGTSGPPAFDGPIAQTLPAFGQSASGTYDPPDRIGTAAQTLPAFEQSASGTNDRPGVDGPIAQSLPAFGQSASGAHVPPGFVGSAATSLPAFGQSAAGVVVAPTFSGTVSQALNAFSQAASGTASLPAFSGSSALSLLPLTQSAAGAFVPPERSGTIESGLPATRQSAVGTTTRPYGIPVVVYAPKGVSVTVVGT